MSSVGDTDAVNEPDSDCDDDDDENAGVEQAVLVEVKPRQLKTIIDQ
jgi:hypothetical protein